MTTLLSSSSSSEEAAVPEAAATLDDSFMNALSNMDANVRDEVCKTISEMSQDDLKKAIDMLKDCKGATGMMPGGEKLTPRNVPCHREGWWYEGCEDAAALSKEHLRTLQSVAKTSGDQSAGAGEWTVALEHYYTAMEYCWQLEPGGNADLGVLHSNCSLASLKLGRTAEALQHAETAVRLRPQWAKAQARRAAALEADGQLVEAEAAFRTAASLSPPGREAGDYEAAAARVEDRLPRIEDITFTSAVEEAPCASTPSASVDATMKPTMSSQVDGNDEDDDDFGEPLDAPMPFTPRHSTITEAAPYSLNV